MQLQAHRLDVCDALLGEEVSGLQTADCGLAFRSAERGSGLRGAWGTVREAGTPLGRVGLPPLCLSRGCV